MLLANKCILAISPFAGLKKLQFWYTSEILDLWQMDFIFKTEKAKKKHNRRPEKCFTQELKIT